MLMTRSCPLYYISLVFENIESSEKRSVVDATTYLFFLNRLHCILRINDIIKEFHRKLDKTKMLDQLQSKHTGVRITMLVFWIKSEGISVKHACLR